MLKKDGYDLSVKIKDIAEQTEELLSEHLEEYSEYGMDDIANELIGIIASLEVVRLRVAYAMTKDEEADIWKRN